MAATMAGYSMIAVECDETRIDFRLKTGYVDQKAYDTARKFAGGWAIPFLEQQWRAMLVSRKSLPKNANGSFIGFAKAYVRKHGTAK